MRGLIELLTVLGGAALLFAVVVLAIARRERILEERNRTTLDLLRELRDLP